MLRGSKTSHVSRPQPCKTLCLIVSSLVTLLALTSPLEGQPGLTRRQRKFANLEEGLVPLYVLGDLNEDGVVDGRDRALLAAIVKSGTSMDTVSCAAAGDLDFNLKLDNADLARMDEWLKAAPRVDIPAVTYSPTLPCHFRHSFLAARFDAHPGEPVPVRFLDLTLTTKNTQVVLKSGPATVTPDADGKGFTAATSTSAKPGELVVLEIFIPRGRRYFFSYPIESVSGGRH